MAIAQSDTRQKYPLSPKKPWKKTISAILGWVITITIFIAVGLPATFVISSSSHMTVPSYFYILAILGVLVFLAIIFVINFIYQKLYFNSYYYDLNDSFIVIRKGVLTPKEISIPYERVQDVYVDQDIFDRIFNLYDVHLSTATYTSGMEAHIDGVEKPAADGLRELLLSTISKKIRHKLEPSEDGQSK